jgi:hypothetical protein
MDTELEQHYLNTEKYSDEEIEELREKQYYVYRGYLNDFRHLFHNKIDDVEFETIFEKLMNGFLQYRLLDMVNTKRYLFNSFKPYLDKEGNIKDEHMDFSSETYCSSSLSHDENEYETDTENID